MDAKNYVSCQRLCISQCNMSFLFLRMSLPYEGSSVLESRFLKNSLTNFFNVDFIKLRNYIAKQDTYFCGDACCYNSACEHHSNCKINFNMVSRRFTA